MIDLIRLENYLQERIKESIRLARWANENGHYELEKSHRYSIDVAQNILTEIDRVKKQFPNLTTKSWSEYMKLYGKEEYDLEKEAE